MEVWELDAEALNLLIMCEFVFQPLDDGVFLKRHLKLELDEKRRKRYKLVTEVIY